MRQALYRMYRPKNFEDIVGQDTIVQILKNQIAEGSISHAYLFSGSRGTGKTSMAKVFAKAINCQQRTDCGPCGTCISCLEGGADILEIDAASNNSVDNIRDIRDNVIYTPSYGRYKVYIIDEVHMLSQGAFNALLKTLEEPPVHVIFILATTEPQKIPQTVLSRVQRYDFKKIEAQAAQERLRYVLDQMEISCEDEVLAFLIQKSEGSLRDALSLLDKVLSLNDLSYEGVSLALGEISYQELERLFFCLHTKDSAGLLNLIEQIDARGKDMRRLLSDLIDYLREVLLLKNEADRLLCKEKEQLVSIRSSAQNLGLQEAIQLMDELSELEVHLKYAVHPKVMIESFFMKKIYKPSRNEQSEMDSSLQEDIWRLEQKIRLLEEKIEQMGNNPTPPPKDPLIQTVSDRAQKMRMPYFDDVCTSVELSEQERGILDEISAKMEEVYQLLQKRKSVNVKALLQNGEPVRYIGDRLYFGYEETSSMLRNMIDTQENRAILEKVLQEVFGKEIAVSFILKKDMCLVEEQQPTEEAIIENLRKAFPDVPIEVYEDEESYRKRK